MTICFSSQEEEIKLKPVIAFDCAEIRERDWCNVVTCHMDTPKAYVWRLQNFVIGEHILSPSAKNQTPIKSCAISACGNFAILGTEGGWIEKFNLQSGISRGIYVDTSESKSCAHYGEVVGVACDTTNTMMISAGFQGDIKVWDFKACKVKSRLEVGRSVTKMVYQRTNGLLATVADDMVLRVFDVLSLLIVRKFEGHTDRITDLCFSDDGKWLLSSSMDGSLRIWDVILARQIDAISVDVSITAISLVNQVLFSGSLDVDSYASGKKVRNVQMPSVSSKQRSEDEEDRREETHCALANQHLIIEEFSKSHFNQQIPDLVTLSLLPKSQWQSLTNLDIIKVRNKPIEPPKKPEKAPFFLPSVPSLSGEILFESNEVTNGKAKDPEVQEPAQNFRKLDLSSPFCQLLQSCADTKDFTVSTISPCSGNFAELVWIHSPVAVSAFTEYIKGLPPSTLDMELRVLQILEDEDDKSLNQRPELHSIGLLLDYFVLELSCKNNFEFIQAVIKLFLKSGETSG
ncbi:hypothetical protein M5K25_004099 [Dendrobium thyrsiflorum]|uniref:WDR36/Utp21 C-terminal domain-containing protein n=1 Tax=Dendrobium thyrsiflorum TaxID=117978 RepID=A0ABD0VT74_DENTH